MAIGDPAEEILQFISKEKNDMVVMATKGRKGKFAFGSVTEKVVKLESLYFEQLSNYDTFNT